MKIRIKNILVFCVLGFGLGCVEQPKFDPCLGKQPTSAEFTISEQLEDGINVYYPLNSDSIFFPQIFNNCSLHDSNSVVGGYNYSYLYFKANNSDASTNYQWKIGDDARVFTTSGFGLYFDPNSVSGFIKIQLIVTQPSHLECGKNYGEKDTVMKLLSLIKLNTNAIHPMEGKYQGYINNNLNDTLTLTIKRAGFVEFNGSNMVNAVNVIDEVFDKYCSYSIENIDWIKASNTTKIHNLKREPITLRSNSFITSNYSVDGFGYYDRNQNKLIYQGRSRFKEYDAQNVYQGYTDNNFTFTGFKK